MGFFSWLTADTRESIKNVHTMTGPTPVYLLQPNGQAPIYEPAYEGYGMFGDIDAYIWVAEQNFTPELLSRYSGDRLRGIAVSVVHGAYYEDAHTNKKFSIFHDAASLLDPTIEHHAIRYDEPLPGYDGRSPNDLIEAGHLIKRPLGVTLRFPLKFSFDRHAVYERLPASEDCPDQGLDAD